MDMSLWNLIQNYIDETGATEAAVLRRAGLNKGLLTAWRARGIPTLPSHLQLTQLAGALNRPYEEVLRAVLHDTRYLPEEVAMEASRVERASDIDNWMAIWTQAAEWLEQAGGNRQEAAAIGRVERIRKGRDPQSVRINAVSVLTGELDLPEWIEPAWPGDNLSEPSDTTEHLRAADKRETSISAEQEGNETP